MADVDSSKAQYYRLADQETDSDGGAEPKAKLTLKRLPGEEDDFVVGGCSPGKRRLPYRGWTIRATYLCCLMTFGFVLALVLVLIAVSPTIYNSKYGVPAGQSSCTSIACVTLAGSIASMANFTADPCTNAWQYACGNLLANKILQDYVARSSFYYEDARTNYLRLGKILNGLDGGTPAEDFEIKAANLYRTCLSVSNATQLGLGPLVQFFNALGGWNATGWTDTRAGLTNALAHLHRVGLFDISSESKLSPFVLLHSDKDDARSVNTFTLSRSGLGMITEVLYLSNATSSVKVANAYRRFMNDFADLLGHDALTRQQYRADLATVYDLEVQLANISLQRASNRSVAKKKVWTLRELSGTVPEIDWIPFAKLLFPLSAHNIFDNTSVHVFGSGYLPLLSALLRATPRQTLCNYMLWLVVRSTAPLLSEPLVAAYNNYKKALRGTEEEPRKLFCVKLVAKSMPLAIGRLYIERLLKKTDITEATLLLKEVINAFKSNLDSVKWMDKATRAAAADKVNHLLYQVGYPVSYSDPKIISTFYQQLTVSASLFNDTLAAWTLLVRAQQQDTVPGKPVVRTQWAMRPTEVNAFFSQSLNAMGLPGAILVRPFFDRKAPAAYNFGALGSIMGHELTHGFDDNGRRFDKDGNLRNWWSRSSLARFKSGAQCIVQSYNNFTVVGHPVNGKMTLDENIADIGGTKIAYKAYKQHVQKSGGDFRLSGLAHLTGDQLYFLARAQYQCSKSTPEELLRRLYVDAHAPLRARVIGTMLNVPEYAKAFHCPVGSAMNPPQPCSIW